MFSSKVNLLQLTALMLEASIDKVVVCPGSRNAAIVHTFKEAGLDCYEVTDERSAGFFALGLVEANGGKPVAVCCTSGSAVVNLAPAVVEAYYRPLPLFVVTAADIDNTILFNLCPLGNLLGGPVFYALHALVLLQRQKSV